MTVLISLSSAYHYLSINHPNRIRGLPKKKLAGTSAASASTSSSSSANSSGTSPAAPSPWAEFESAAAQPDNPVSVMRREGSVLLEE